MNNSKLVASYKCGFGKVFLYDDRIELGTSNSMESYRYKEIHTFNFLNFLVQKNLFLTLRNGSTTESVVMYNKDAKECQPLLEQFISNAQISSKNADAAFVKCNFLGGSGVPFLSAGESCLAIFDKIIVSIESDTQRTEIKLNELTALKIEGPGRVTTNAGVMGGGFGLEGAAWGIGAAALVNTLTTSTTTNTIIYLAWTGAEVFLHTSDFTPEEARLALSHSFTATQSVKNSGVPDIASQLERLVLLKNSGALTEEEYLFAKTKLIDGLR